MNQGTFSVREGYKFLTAHIFIYGTGFSSSRKGVVFMQVATRVFFNENTFLRAKSTASYLGGRYSEKVLREEHVFEKLDYKHRQVQLDLDFLI